MKHLALLFRMAWRNLWRNRRRTLITAASVMFAVVLALLMESMNTGQHEQMISNTLRFGTGYMQIQDTVFHETPSLDFSFPFDQEFRAQLENTLEPGSYLVPRIEAFVLAAGEINTRGAMVIGIEPELENQMNGFQKFLKQGSLFEASRPEVIMGSGLARRLDLDLGDTLIIIGQGFQGMQAAGKYLVKGILEHPMEPLDNQVIYMSLDEASWLFSLQDQISHLIIMTDSDTKATRMQAPLRIIAATRMLEVYHWKELQPDLVKALAFDSVSGRIFQVILYVVIGFGIFGTVLTMTLERQKEFAIMVSLGMKRHLLAIQCFVETVLISFLGVFSGLALGFPVLLYFYHNPIPLGDNLAELVKEYGLEPYLPFSLASDIFIFQGVTMLIIALIITAYPVYRSFRFALLENLRK